MEILPIVRKDFGLQTHRVRHFDATVPGSMTKKDLENTKFWDNVASDFLMGAEVRCVADDMSFVATGICTYAEGTTVKIAIISFDKLDSVDVEKASPDFSAKLCGSKKWCIFKNADDTMIKEDIATKAEAERFISDYVKALAA